MILAPSVARLAGRAPVAPEPRSTRDPGVPEVTLAGTLAPGTPAPGTPEPGTPALGTPALGTPEPLFLPRRLRAAQPTWSIRGDVVVVGSGVAGLMVALRLSRFARVLVVTKARVDAGATRWAQGGIAAALGPGDTPEQHLADTLAAGAGLCVEEAVRVLVNEGPDVVRELAELGARFDVEPNGDFALTREGGHLRRRIVHARDATGAEIERALIAAARSNDRIQLIEHALALDLLPAEDGRICGVSLHVLGEGRPDGVGAAVGRAVVLATGGLGQVFAATTNPPEASGDGVAMALRAGAEIVDLEFVQFHPTVLWLGPDARGQLPLISEAVRGEGAVLIDVTGERFMDGVHPLAELAPRYVVARAIVERMRATGADHVLLDARRVPDFERRFPTIAAACRRFGVDPVTTPIPVAPGAHYACGGVRTDLRGRTTVPGLYACGEVAGTGVHGANRLASNSLLEGLVFAARVADDLSGGLPRAADPAERDDEKVTGLLAADAARRIRLAMTDGVGVLRDADGLAVAGERLAAEWTPDLASLPAEAAPEPESWEATNLHAVASVLTRAASLRTESRGCHWRADYPETSSRWHGHLVSVLNADGMVLTRFEPRGTPEAG